MLHRTHIFTNHIEKNRILYRTFVSNKPPKKMTIFILSILNLISFIHPAVDARNQFEPFILEYVCDSSTSNYWSIPREPIPSLDDRNMIASCPIETDEEKINLKIISRTYPQAEYCLYEKNFDQEESKLCTEKPKPWLEHVEGDDKQCGMSANYKAYDIGFYFCGKPMPLTTLRRKQNDFKKIEWFENILNLRKSGKKQLPIFFRMYRLCIDSTNGKTWKTVHEIKTPAMFKDDQEKLKRETGGDTEISTDPIFFEESTFIGLKQKYNAQDEASEKMIETFLVPKEHVALRSWRYTVNHFINVAPLWIKLEKLMTAINQGIRKIALKLHSNIIHLSVYTSVHDLQEEEGSLTQANGQFPNNIWYKLLRQDEARTVALVVLHNTPNSPPEQKICEVEMACDLKKWYEKDSDDDEEISDEVSKYAYCCNPNESEIEHFFNEKFLIKGPLNLDNFFKNFEN